MGIAVIRALRRVGCRVRDDQAGLALLPYLVLIAVLASAPIWIPAVQDIHDLATGKWNPKEQQAPPPTEADLPFIGPGLPSDPTKADCVKKEADKVGLSWTAKGWRTSDIDEPSLVGDPAKVRANIDFFRRRMEAFVGSRQKEWESCLKDLPPPAPETPSSEPVLNPIGTYTMQYASPAPHCDSAYFPPPATMIVGGSPDAMTVALPSYDNYTDQLTGGYATSGSFSANGLRQIGGGLGLRMLGQFQTDGTATTVSNGSLTYNGPTDCTFTFTATKQ